MAKGFMPPDAREFLRRALAEDIGHGDITTALIVADETARANIIAKEPLIICGLPFVSQIFSILSADVSIEILRPEGASANKGDIIATLSGPASSILAGERLSLNLMQRLSGIAALASAFSDKVKDLPVSIADTRKTAPGLRLLEKYAVRVGGATNHRFGLYDGVLIKDNHIRIAGSIGRAVDLARRAHHLLKIEVEVSSMEGLKEAIEAGADIVMLDNMAPDLMRQAVSSARTMNRAVLIEASGNVTLENVRAVAESGVDIISIGAITHSARAVDISMKII